MSWLASFIDIDGLIEQLTKANWTIVIVAIPAIQLVCFVLRAVRQTLILNRLGLKLPLLWLVCVQCRANFFRNFVPGGIGGDLYKAYSVGQTTETRTEPVATVFVERLFGIGAMLLVSLVALLCSSFWLEASVFYDLSWPVLGASLIFVLMNVLLVLGTRGTLTVRALEGHRPFKIGKEVAGQVVLFIRGAEGLKLLAVSIVIQMAIVVWYFTISTALGLEVSLGTYMIVIPLVEILMMLPISVAGIGVRDGALVFLLAPFGVSSVSALSLSVASLSVATIVNALSGAAFCFNIAPGKALGENYSGPLKPITNKHSAKGVRL